MSRVFGDEVAFLGATSSPAFVRAPEGNGCAERFIRTLKENWPWVQPLQHARGAAPGAPRVQGHLQHHMADRTPRASNPRRRATRPAFTRGSGRLGPTRVSHDPGAVHM